MAKLELKNKDCFDCFQYIPNESVDLIFTGLPYGVTKNKWDSELKLEKLWAEYEIMIKHNGAIVLFGQDKFSARLMLSNEKLHRYNIIWEKNTDYYRLGYQNYRLYDNLSVCEKYFENLEKMQKFMIDSLANQNVFISNYQYISNKRNSKRLKKSKYKLQAKYASKFKRKSWWNFR